MATLYYQIAEQYLAIEHGDVECLRSTLAKYQAFEEEALPAGQSPLLSVVCDETIEPLESDRQVEHVVEPSFSSTVYERADGSYYLRISFRGYVVDGWVQDNWSRLSLRAQWTERTAYLIDRLVMICFTMATLPLGYLKVHASVTELNGRALVLMGVSGTGKSTHSRLWREYIEGCTLLNDDEPIVRRVGDKVVVYGCPWSGSTPCYRQESAEVSAFVLLRQAPFNKLQRLSGRESFDALFSSCAFMSSRTHRQSLIFNSVASVLEIAPVYRMDNRPEREAVEMTRTLL